MAQTQKAKMQMLLLGIVVAGAALFALVNFVVVPAINGLKRDAAQTRAIESEIEEARSVVRSRNQVASDAREQRRRMRELMSHIPMPVLGNYLLGMNNQVHEWARRSGLEIVSIAHSDVVQLGDGGGVFNINRLRVAALGGVHTLMDFLDCIEEDNPLVTVSALSINAMPGEPGRHDIRLLLGWLVWAQPDDRPDYVLAAEMADENGAEEDGDGEMDADGEPVGAS